MLSADYYAAAKTFREVAPKLKSEEQKEQLKAFQAALEISAYEMPTAETEEAAYRLWKEEELFRKYPDFSDFLRDKLFICLKKGCVPRVFRLKAPFAQKLLVP